MSPPTLEIEFDRPDRRYRTGEPIGGHVMVTAEEAVPVLSLKMDWEWRTAGKGSEYREEGGTARFLERADLAAGEQRSVPFRIDPLAGPPSLARPNLAVGWVIVAKLVTKGQGAVVRTEEFFLEPGEPETATYVGPTMEGHVDDAPTNSGFDVKLFSGCSAGFAILGALGPMLVWFEFADSGAFGKVVIGLVVAFSLFCLAMFLVTLGHLARSIAGTLALGVVRVELEPGTLHRGEEMRCRVRFTSRQDIEIAKLEGKLVAEEDLEDEDDEDHEKEILKKVFVLCEARRVMAGEEVEIEGVLAVPSDAPWSLAAPDNEVKWEAKLELSLEGRKSTWTANRDILVLP